MNTERDRDRSVERVLGQAFRAGAGADITEACLDAETLAAWADQGLTADELANVETHLSECSRCQSLVATLERTHPAGAEREAWWPPRFGFGWLVPLTAAAAAILLWVALPGNEPARSPASTSSSASTNVQEPTAAAPRLQEPSLAERRQAPAVVREEPRAPAAATADARDDLANAAQPGALGGALKAGRDGRRPEEHNAPSRDARDVRQGDAREARRDDRTRAQEPATLDSVGRGSPPTAAPSAQTQAAGRSAPANELTFASSARVPARATAREIASPDPSFRWRIGAAGVVEHSTDGGSTWEVLSTGVVADLTAGTSPSPSVCWLVGRAGAVLLSVDGRRWRRVTFPEPTELVAVQASDARTATVTTADGRTFRTADGGVSWDRRPLQEF